MSFFKRHRASSHMRTFSRARGDIPFFPPYLTTLLLYIYIYIEKPQFSAVSEPLLKLGDHFPFSNFLTKQSQFD